MSEDQIVAPKPKRTRRRPAQIDAEAIIAAAKAEAAKIIAEATETSKPELPPETELERQTPNVIQERVWITLSENPTIPRGGQFFGVNGQSFLLRPGKKALVPQALLDVLNNAIEGYPIQDPDTLQVVDYGQRLRYPYIFHQAG